MIRALIRRKLHAEERKLGGSLDYVHFILDTSIGAFLRFVRVLPLANYRRTLPLHAHWVARLVATRDADCGTCVQIEVNLARKAGVPAEIVRATLDSRLDALPEDLALVHRFVTAVVRSTGAEDVLRDDLRAQIGERGLVELALAISGCRVFPIIKRTLGFAKTCAKVQVEVA